jgi:hypothetical protein
VTRHGWSREEESADRWGPHVSERKREKALLLECTNLKRRRLLVNAPQCHEPSGLREGGSGLRGRWVSVGGLGRIPIEDSKEILFSNLK